LPNDVSKKADSEIRCAWLCGICSAVCREDAIRYGSQGLRIEAGRCSHCMICVKLCPAGNLEEDVIAGL
jgi:ferredoxin